jgi:hypothetical protein
MPDFQQLNQFQSQAALDIKGTSDSYKGMIMSQINRITYLLTMGNAKYEGVNQMFSTDTLAKSALRGIQVLEAMITPIMSEEYEEATRSLKEGLLKNLKLINQNEIQYYDYYTRWLTEIIRHLGKLNMLPEEEIELEFE